MNVTLIKLAATNRLLKRVADALDRLAECYEMDLNDRGLTPPERVRTTKVSADEPSLSYVDEEADFLRELSQTVKKAREVEEAEGAD